MSRLGDAFARARGENRAAFVAYLTAGDPSADATVELAKALERAGADVLELGVPFSDPIADGPVLQRAASRALASGTTLDVVFDIARRIRNQTRLALVLFSYVNPVHRMGIADAARRAAEAGFDGALMTDLPPEEAAPIVGPLRRAGLDTVFLASPTSPAARMREAARLSSGFLYVVSRPGTTGARAELPARPSGHRRAGAKCRASADRDRFGISTPRRRRAARSAGRRRVGLVRRRRAAARAQAAVESLGGASPKPVAGRNIARA